MSLTRVRLAKSSLGTCLIIKPHGNFWQYSLAVAMSSIRRGRTAIVAQGKLASLDPASNDAITEVYNYFGITDPNQTPSNEARQNASRLLGGINSDV